MEKFTYKGFDILKFVCSLFIVALHINPIPHDSTAYFLSRALGRLGVPCFFMIAGFLFSVNVMDLSESECRKYFLKYIKRIFIILIIWLIPYFFVYDIWWIRQEGLPNGIFEYISHIFFGGKYFFLWYLVALLIGVTLAFLFYKKHVAGGCYHCYFLS